MCILSFIPDGVRVDSEITEHLWNGGISNPDGHGFAIASDHGMVVSKSMKLDECLSNFVDARDKYPTGPALFHSRWATHGSVRLGLCHPFLVGGSGKTVVAHNGVLPRAAHPSQGDDRSDTAILADELLPRQWRRLDKPSVRKSLAQFCGAGNKLVILTTDTRYRRRHYLVNESRGVWDTETGVWHSNHDYLFSYKYSVPAPSEPFVFGGDDPTQCDYCGQRVNDFNLCTVCGTCQDCYEPAADCLCHIPEAMRRLVIGSG